MGRSNYMRFKEIKFLTRKSIVKNKFILHIKFIKGQEFCNTIIWQGKVNLARKIRQQIIKDGINFIVQIKYLITNKDFLKIR